MPGSVMIHKFLQYKHDRGYNHFMGHTKEKKNCLKVFVVKEEGNESFSKWNPQNKPKLVKIETQRIVESRPWLIQKWWKEGTFHQFVETHEIFQYCKVSVNLEKGTHTARTNWAGLFSALLI